jgi:hypothetical protein
MATERLELRLTANARDAVSGIRDTGLASGQLDTKLKGLEGTLGKVGAIAGMTGGQMGFAMAAGALTAGVAVGKFVGDSVTAFVSLADKVRDFSRASGLGADASSRLVAVFDDLEISQATADTGFFKLNRSIADGSTNLEEYGVKVARTKDGNLDTYGTLLNIASAYKNASDDGERAAIVQEAFGKAGKALVPILEQGRKGIEELYAAVPDRQILDEGQVAQARAYELAVDDLKDAFQELQYAVAGEVIPTLTSFASTGAGTIRFLTDAKSGVEGFAGGLGGVLVDSVEKSIPGIGQLKGITDGLGKAFGWGGEETDKFTDSQKRLQEAQQEVARLAADNKQGTDEMAAAQREENQAKNEYEAVLGRVNAALGENTSKLLENTAAGQAAINGLLGLAGAELNVEAALVKYIQTMQDSKSTDLEKRQSLLAVEQSYTAFGEAAKQSALTAGASQQEAARAQIEALDRVRNTLAPDSPLRAFLDQYIGTIVHGIPAYKSTYIDADTSAAIWKLAVLRERLAEISRTYIAGGGSGHGEVVEYSQGGWVGGIGNSDTVPAMLTPGEFVLSKDMLAGRASLPTGVGGGGGGGNGAVNFYIYDATDPDKVMRAIAQHVNNNGSVPPRVKAAFS